MVLLVERNEKGCDGLCVQMFDMSVERNEKGCDGLCVQMFDMSASKS